ncbi:MAG: hypothetical protein V1859_02410 [archaeon]
MIDYSSLGTSNKRMESVRDHQTLRALFDEKWKSIKTFSRLSPQDIKSWQLQRIIELVDFAYKTVPLYQEKYHAVGFIPGDIKTWGDFESLPILYKDELIDGFPKKTISSKHTLEFTTRSSGSSGRFVTLAVSPDAVYLDTIQGVRQFHMQSGGNYDPTDLAFFIYTSPWWVSSVDGMYPTQFLLTTTPIDDAVKVLAQAKPKVLSIYPTYLRQLCTANADLKSFGIELIVIHSEQSTTMERKSYSDFFGIPVLDEFSSEELTRIALECPSRRYHLEEDACYIEIVDTESKKPLEPGNRGLVIGTNLLNTATPIIRYSQGDLASIEGVVNCSCGSNFRVMNSPEGRLMDSVLTTDGRTVPASCFMDLAYNWYLELDIPVHGLRYQFVQEQEGNINVYIVPGLYGLSPSQKERLGKSLYQLLPQDMSVTINVVDEIPYNNGAKYRPVLSFANR